MVVLNNICVLTPTGVHEIVVKVHNPEIWKVGNVFNINMDIYGDMKTLKCKVLDLNTIELIEEPLSP